MAVHRITTPDGHTVRYIGTLDQAEAYAELMNTHDTDPRHAELLAILHPTQDTP